MFFFILWQINSLSLLLGEKHDINKTINIASLFVQLAVASMWQIFGVLVAID